jgi:hypothetical protein
VLLLEINRLGVCKEGRSNDYLRVGFNLATVNFALILFNQLVPLYTTPLLKRRGKIFRDSDVQKYCSKPRDPDLKDYGSYTIKA